MTDTTSILDASIEDILGEVDDNIKYENIDADAILGEVDEFLAENAIKPEDKTEKKTTISSSNEEEQLDYEEDNVAADNGHSKKEAKQSISNLEIKRDREQRFNRNKNFEDDHPDNYYVNPNFRGPFPPDMMILPRGPPYGMPFAPHPRFYGGYHGGGPPMRYPSMMGPPGMPAPYSPHPLMYGPPSMGGGRPPMHLGPCGSYGAPPRSFRYSGDFRRPKSADANRTEVKSANSDGKSEKEAAPLSAASSSTSSTEQANKNAGDDEDNVADPNSAKSTNGMNATKSETQQQSKAAAGVNQSQRSSHFSAGNNNGTNKKDGKFRKASPVRKLPTVRIGSGTASTSSSHSSVIAGGGAAQPVVPSVSNINAIVTASLRAPLAGNKTRQPASSIGGLLTQQQQQPVPLRTTPSQLLVNSGLQARLMAPNLPLPQPVVHLPPPQPGGGYVGAAPIVAPPMHFIQQQQPFLNNGVSMAPASDAVNWSMMVDAFVKKTSNIDSSRRRSYSRSPPYSSRSRSRSYTRSLSGNRFSSRSRSPIPTRSPRSPLPAPRQLSRNERRHSSRTRRDKRDESLSRRGGGSRRNDSRNDGETKEDMKRTRECAQAIGLDDEYLRKVEEQKRLREELTRIRSQKRQQNFGGGGGSNEPPATKRGGSPTRHRGTAAGRRERRSSRDSRGRSPLRDAHRGRGGGGASPNRGRHNGDKSRRPRESLTTKGSISSSGNSTTIPNSFSRFGASAASNNNNKEDMYRNRSASKRHKSADRNSECSSGVAIATASGKLKAYLAVVVSNVKELENSYKRIVTLSNSIGSTKKVWQTSENTISIIFVKHEHAKQFMLQYHGKSMGGYRLDVSLEKVFLNLAAMPS